MALKKAIELDNGYSPEYWCIGTMNVNLRINHVVVILEAYKDRETSKKQKSRPITTAQLEFTGEDTIKLLDFKELSKKDNNLCKRIYTILKQLPQFEGAEDILEEE